MPYTWLYTVMVLIVGACLLSAAGSYLRQAFREANRVIRDAPWPEQRSHVRRIDRLRPYDFERDE